MPACRDEEPPFDDPWRDLSGTIYVLRSIDGGALGAVDPVAGTVRPLLEPSLIWYETAASPDGGWLLLQRRAIERLELPSLVRTNVAPDEDAAVNRGPAIAPDGQHMAWQRTGDSGTSIMVQSSAEPLPIVIRGPLRSFSAVFMQWLNDREVAWIGRAESPTGMPEITAIDIQTRAVRIVGREANLETPLFLVRRTSEELLVMQGPPDSTELWLADTSGALKRRVASLKGVAFVAPFSLSPDGRYVAVPSLGSTGTVDLLLIDILTGAMRELPISGGDEVDPAWTIKSE